jgi:hypothetical protein
MEPTMKKLTLAALGIIALAALPVSAANWSDTYLGYQYGTQFREPGLQGTIEKNRFELNHVSGWDYGTNFFDVTMLSSSHKDPAQNAQAPNFGGGQPQANVPGATEVYVAYRSNFDLGKIFKTKMSFGPVRETDFTVGGDFDSKDNQFGSNKKFIMAGPQVGFNVTNGFWNLGLSACRELNYNGVVMQAVNFKTTYMISTAWGKNFQLGVPAEFKGWANYIGPKGKDGFGVDTKAETVGDMYVMFDMSQFIGRKKGAITIGPGFEYWNNKFGGKNFTAPASQPYNNNQQVNAFMLAAEFHF